MGESGSFFAAGFTTSLAPNINTTSQLLNSSYYLFPSLVSTVCIAHPNQVINFDTEHFKRRVIENVGEMTFQEGNGLCLFM